MIRILLKSHSINYRDREGPLAAQNTKWLPNRLPSAHPGESSWDHCVTLGVPCPLWASLCISSGSAYHPLLTQGPLSLPRPWLQGGPGRLGWLPRGEKPPPPPPPPRRGK